MELAKSLLNSRTGIELRFESFFKDELIGVFRELAAIGYSEPIPPQQFQFSKCKNNEKVNEILTKFAIWIYMRQINLANEMIRLVYESYGSSDFFLCEDYINLENYGHTNKERIRIYVNRFKYEAESWIAAGLILGLSLEELVNNFRLNFKKPYNNNIFNRASKNRRASATRLNRKKSFGIGQYSAFFNMIVRLVRYSIADMMRRAQYNVFKEKGAIGYIVQRGSTYDCPLCDSKVGTYTLKYADLPPYHINCKCFVIPIFQVR